MLNTTLKTYELTSNVKNSQSFYEISAIIDEDFQLHPP